MPDIDPFTFFRWGLFIVVSVYVSIVSIQQGYSWYVWLMSEDRYIAVLRRYVIVHGLRLRFATFWGDVLICGLLCIVFVLLFWAHRIIEATSRALS